MPRDGEASQEETLNDVGRQRVALLLRDLVPVRGLGGIGVGPDAELDPACELERRLRVALDAPPGEEAQLRRERGVVRQPDGAWRGCAARGEDGERGEHGEERGGGREETMMAGVHGRSFHR